MDQVSVFNFECYNKSDVNITNASHISSFPIFGLQSGSPTGEAKVH